MSIALLLSPPRTPSPLPFSFLLSPFSSHLVLPPQLPALPLCPHPPGRNTADAAVDPDHCHGRSLRYTHTYIRSDYCHRRLFGCATSPVSLLSLPPTPPSLNASNRYPTAIQPLSIQHASIRLSQLPRPRLTGPRTHPPPPHPSDAVVPCRLAHATERLRTFLPQKLKL